jgi:NAD(P)-dependent dehydrogenase (short-subunit alcohol dehydrogenase family)
MSRVTSALVIGANRGIGLATTRALLDDPAMTGIVATYRSADSAEALAGTDDSRLRLFQLEVTDQGSIERLASAIKSAGISPELVVHCAGILHEDGVQPEKSLRHCDAEALQRLFAVNSIAPLMLARALIPLMPKRQTAHFAVLSAMVGSIADNRLGGWYGYRASKAALNQFIRTLAIECRRTHPELCITAIHPGTTDTGLSRPFQANVEPGKLYSAQQTAARILEVVYAGTPGVSGRFVNWDGSDIPW